MPTNNIKEGYFTDYISGLPVKETPEELEAVQPFSKILVDDYGYPKEFIHTRPQYRVKARPSDRRVWLNTITIRKRGPKRPSLFIFRILGCAGISQW